MPTTITIASEYCPKARRSSLVTLMFCGFTIGSAMGGFIAAQVLPALRVARAPRRRRCRAASARAGARLGCCQNPFDIS